MHVDQLAFWTALQCRHTAHSAAMVALDTTQNYAMKHLRTLLHPKLRWGTWWTIRTRFIGHRCTGRATHRVDTQETIWFRTENIPIDLFLWEHQDVCRTYKDCRILSIYLRLGLSSYRLSTASSSSPCSPNSPFSPAFCSPLWLLQFLPLW